MSGRNFSFSTPEYLVPDTDSYWNADAASQYLWDSPHPDEYQPTGLEDNASPRPREPSTIQYPTAIPSPQSARQQNTAGNKPPSNLHISHGVTSAPSTASESSSHSSSSGPSAGRERNPSSESSPPGLFKTEEVEDTPPGVLKMEDMYGDGDDTFQLDDSTFPTVGAGMDNLSLNTGVNASPEFKYSGAAPSPDPLSAGLFADRNEAYSPRNYAALRNFQSNIPSPMTVQPSKMFYLGESRENSPNGMSMLNADESPAPFYNGHSPLSNTSDAFGNTMSGNPNMNGMMFDPQNMDVSRMPLTKATSAQSIAPRQSTVLSQWPCKLTVDAIPDKSRVETQIPIKLTLHNVPAGTQRLHLPSHTISKPKFQSKPPFRTSSDALELSTMLVCASAMQKEGLEDVAFLRATTDETCVVTDELNGGNQTDENDPMRPLNGGPVAICQGCIVRERKRAARKKTKKADEEEEWAKDEAKRVIVFNCAEVRDWCVPGTKETAVRDHETEVDTMFVTAPMRIACYCRHQSEKLGFQVIFTIKTSDGKILAQAMSDSIMITDDHKQPSATSAIGIPFGSGQIPGAGIFTSGGQPFGMYPTFSQEMPFRSSWSTNDLRTLGYAPQRRPTTFHRQNSGGTGTGYSSQVSTATATPRNLSRPASPTSPGGHSTKKRRSGGPSHNKLPSGLTMTRIEDLSPTTAANMASNGPLSTGGSSSGFNFNSSQQGGFGGALEQQFGPTPVATPNPYTSGPSTPMTGGMPNNYGPPANFEDRFQFYSAPTSQHASRAPSPTNTRGQSFNSMQVPQQAAFALSSLPVGMNLQKPPIIQRLIPHMGSRSGGDEVTVLGSGFFQGLDVMFGDKMATNTTFWGDTTLVCRAPPSAQTGLVPVVFRHQHHTAPQELQQLQGLLPTMLVPYNYFDEERSQMQSLPVGMASQHQRANVGQMSNEELARNFANGQGGFPNFKGGVSNRMTQ